jgi:hypothetical protein
MLQFQSFTFRIACLCPVLTVSILMTGQANCLRAGDVENPTRPEVIAFDSWGYHPLTLLNEEPVRKELELSPDQVKTLDRLVNGYLDALRPITLKARGATALPPEQRKAALTRIADEQRRTMSEFNALGMESLREPQRRRLGEICLQLRGVQAFFLPSVVTTLGLDDHQKEQIALVRVWLISEAKHRHAEDPARGMPNFLGARHWDEAKRRIMALLTPGQVALIEQMHGRPIAFSEKDLSLTLRHRSDNPGQRDR